MECKRDTRWKYLREEGKYFNPRIHTSLNEYLRAIFPNNEFRYHQLILDSVPIPEGVKAHRYVCDAICIDKRLVVEFDGVDHYMNSTVCVNDKERDEWFKTVGLETVRIPYWIQLSNLVVRDLFHVEVYEELCQLDHSFYFPETKKVNMNILPGNMCELGRERFIREFNNFCPFVRRQIMKDLLTCLEHLPKELQTYALPESVFCQLKI